MRRVVISVFIRVRRLLVRLILTFNRAIQKMCVYVKIIIINMWNTLFVPLRINDLNYSRTKFRRASRDQLNRASKRVSGLRWIQIKLKWLNRYDKAINMMSISGGAKHVFLLSHDISIFYSSCLVHRHLLNKRVSLSNRWFLLWLVYGKRLEAGAA